MSMVVACGRGFTVIVNHNAEVLSFGNNDTGQLGLGHRISQQVPVHVGGSEVFGEDVLDVAVGMGHTGCLTQSGGVWMWGYGKKGQLGIGNFRTYERPVSIVKELHGNVPAIMLACGSTHTLILTEDCLVWSFGNGKSGRLGHGNQTQESVCVPTPVGMQMGISMEPIRIAMVAAGESHSVALGVCGEVLCWGLAQDGRLGVWDFDDTNFCSWSGVPTHVRKRDERAAFSGHVPVMIAAGNKHTIILTNTSRPWVFGDGSGGQLGIGGAFKEPRSVYLPMELPHESDFANSPVISVNCGPEQTYFLTADGRCWMNGSNIFGSFEHSEQPEFDMMLPRQIPTCVDAEHFAGNRVIFVGGGEGHLAAVDCYGTLFTWGKKTRCLLCFDDSDEDGATTVDEVHFPGGTGHLVDKHTVLQFPMELYLQKDARVGNYLPRALAFAMGTHQRLGGATEDDVGCVYVLIPCEMIERMVKAHFLVQ